MGPRNRANTAPRHFESITKLTPEHTSIVRGWLKKEGKGVTTRRLQIGDLTLIKLLDSGVTLRARDRIAARITELTKPGVASVKILDASLEDGRARMTMLSLETEGVSAEGVGDLLGAALRLVGS